MQSLAQDLIIAICQATGGGLLVAGVAYLACGAVRRLTAPVRFWLWWLVGAKFLIGLALAVMGVSALRVPVLAADHYYRLTGLARKTVAQAGHASPLAAAPRVDKPRSQEKRAGGVTSVPIPSGNPPELSEIRLSSVRRDASRAVAAWILPISAVYLAGLAAMAWRFVSGARAIKREIAGAEVCENLPTLGDYQSVAARLRISDLPPLLVSMRTSVPFAVGVIRPAIVIPAAFLAENSESRRMALAHELAHVRRRDLVWEVVPVLLRAIFWFLPPAHFAANEIASAREEACDLLAISACDSSPAVYASLLIRVSERASSALPVMAMAAPASRGFRQVKRRLRTLAREGNGNPVPGVWRAVAGVLLITQVTATVLPLRPALARAAEAARAALPPAQPPHYLLTDLGTLGGRESGAFGVNDEGQVVGTAQVYPLGTRGHAFIWEQGGIRDLTSGSAFRHSQGVSISDNGYVAGYAYRSSYRSAQQNAFLWDGTRRLYLPPAKGYRFSRAENVSESGSRGSGGKLAVVGASLTGGTDRLGATVAHATLWRENKVTPLGTLGGPHSAALAVNANVTVVGKADLPEDEKGQRQTHPFAWSAELGGMRDLGTLGGGSGSALGVNRDGTVVGYAQTADGAVHGFVGAAFGGEELRDLGVLAGMNTSAAFSVNDHGMIVGQSVGPDRPGRAVFWHSPSAKPVDLNACIDPAAAAAGWHLETARDINTHGQIVGQGIVGGKKHAFLLTPR